MVAEFTEPDEAYSRQDVAAIGLLNRWAFTYSSSRCSSPLHCDTGAIASLGGLPFRGYLSRCQPGERGWAERGLFSARCSLSRIT